MAVNNCGAHSVTKRREIVKGSIRAVDGALSCGSDQRNGTGRTAERFCVHRALSSTKNTADCHRNERNKNSRWKIECENNNYYCGNFFGSFAKIFRTAVLMFAVKCNSRTLNLLFRILLV